MPNYCKLNAMALCDCEKKIWADQKNCDFAECKSTGGNWCVYYRPNSKICDNTDARKKAKKKE